MYQKIQYEKLTKLVLQLKYQTKLVHEVNFKLFKIYSSLIFHSKKTLNKFILFV